MTTTRFTSAVQGLGEWDVTISNGTSLSPSADIYGYGLIALILPATWTAASVTVQGCMDNSTFNGVYDDQGNEYTIQAAASRYIILDPNKFSAFRFIKLRSGTSGSPVNQAADRVLTLVGRNFQ